MENFCTFQLFSPVFPFFLFFPNIETSTINLKHFLESCFDNDDNIRYVGSDQVGLLVFLPDLPIRWSRPATIKPKFANLFFLSHFRLSLSLSSSRILSSIKSPYKTNESSVTGNNFSSCKKLVPKLKKKIRLSFCCVE